MSATRNQFSLSGGASPKRFPVLRTACAARLLPLLLLTLPAVVQAQFTFTTNNGAITITSFTGTNAVVTIPATTNGYPVTGIADDAFYDCTSLTSLTIPDSVTSIGTNAFNNCTSLTNVTLGTNITTIGDNVFGFCYDLASVTIPNSVTSIGSYAFYACISLTNVTIPTNVTTIGDLAFSGCRSLVNITIPESVTNIGDWEFDDCFSLSAITVDALNSSYSSVDGALFDKSQTTLIQCPGGKAGSYTVPNSVTSIESYAFEACISLTNVLIPSSVTNIGDNAFNACSSLAAITVDALNPVYSSVNGVLFNQNHTTLVTCPGGKTGIYVVSNSVTSIGDDAFWGCSSLTSLTIPNSVTSIGEWVFMFCANLTNLTIGSSVTNIGSYAFSFCTSLPSVTIPSGVTSIGDWTFYQCTSLTVANVPNTVTNIGNWTFFDCTTLTNITIPSSVTSIGGGAFAGCTGLEGVYFSGNAPSADSSVFPPGVFGEDGNATAYYLPGTTGWGAFSTNAGIPAVLWNPQVQTSGTSFGVRTNQFGFNITGTSNMAVVVEACTNLANPAWSPVATNTLTSGSSYFSDPQWTNYPARFYRLRSP